MLKVRWIVDREDRVDHALKNMIAQFKQRGYPREVVENHKTRVKTLSRSESFKPKLKTSSKRIPFVTTYSDWSGKIGKIINKYWFIVRDSYKNIEEFKNSPLVFYRRPPNVFDKLVKSVVGPKSTKNNCSFLNPRQDNFPVYLALTVDI